MTAVRAAEVEVLITAPTDNVEEADKKVRDVVDRINKTTATQKITGDEKPALAGMDRVEAQAKKLVSQKTALKLDADISAAEKQTDRVRQRLQDLEVKALGGLDVTASTTRAERELSRLEKNLDGLRKAKTLIEVDADVSEAETALDGVKGPAAKAGKDVGGELGDNIVAALLSIPIAGAVVGIGAAAGKALFDGIQDGLGQELGRDRLAALTGISEGDALRFARVAAQAYTQGFGESIEQNMDTARLGLQFDLLDPENTARDAQQVISGLSGIASALDEDVRPVATAVTTLLRTGLAKTSQEAFDILAAGQREGLNRADDLLDTFTEYPVVLRKLGLSGKDSLDLINQGLTAGARNSDVVADALKEFQIRATDGSKASSEGFKALGFDAEEMTAKIARGGSEARAGLDEVLTTLRATEDPVVRNAAAVALFGTKAEDLGDALFALDLDSTASKFDNLQGSAQRMFDTLTDNDASKIQTAQRNIEVAADGIKGALASAFSDPIEDFADFVSQNRGPVLQFMQDLALGAIDFGISLVNAAADGTESFGELVSGPLASTVDAAGKLALVLGDANSAATLLKLSEEMRGFDESTSATAQTMRDRLVPSMEAARDRASEFFEGEVAMGYLNDASLRLADSIGHVGYAADGTKLSLEKVDLANLSASTSGLALENQIRNSVAALSDEIAAADAAGESQEGLTERYNAGRAALIGQLEQMGLTTEQAQALTDTILRTPAAATTAYGSNAAEEQAKVQALATRVETLPDGTLVVRADTSQADAELRRLTQGDFTTKLNVLARMDARAPMARGGLVEFMADGGLRGTRMSPVAQMVPPNTWRVVGDRSDVDEAYIPLDGSARSMAVFLETARRMGVLGMADGGVVAARDSAGSTIQVTVEALAVPEGLSPRRAGREFGEALQEKLSGRGL